jgi:hypothetical protein
MLLPLVNGPLMSRMALVLLPFSLTVKVLFVRRMVEVSDL